MSAIILFATGLVLYYVVCAFVDSLSHRAILSAFGDPLITKQFSRGREVSLNIVRPALQTIVIFGGGMAVVTNLGIRDFPATLSGVWFFFLSYRACTNGRGASYERAAWACINTAICLSFAYIAAFY